MDAEFNFEQGIAAIMKICTVIKTDAAGNRKAIFMIDQIREMAKEVRLQILKTKPVKPKRKFPKKCEFPMIVINWLSNQSDCQEIKFDSSAIAKSAGFDQGGTNLCDFVGDAFEDASGRVWAIVAYCECDMKYFATQDQYEPWNGDWNDDFSQYVPQERYKGDYDVSSIHTYHGDLFFRQIDKTGVFYKYWDKQSAENYNAIEDQKTPMKKAMKEAEQFFQTMQAMAEIAKLTKI